MPRNSSGVYALPAGNPVYTNTIIATSWANPTLGDIAAELTNSLDRTGRGGMLAPFRIFDGSISQPGIAFANESSLGIWRSASGLMQFVGGGVNHMRLDTTMGGMVFPTKVLHYSDSQWRRPGERWWQIAPYANVLYLSNATTIDAEDWVARFTFGPDGSFGCANLSTGNITASGGITVTGGITAGGPIVANGGITTPGGITATSLVLQSLTVNGAGTPNTIIQSSSGAIGVSAGAHKLEVRGAGAAGDASYMAFHRPGAFAAYFGVETDNTWRVGGWSMGAVSYRLLHEGNSFNFNTANELNTSFTVKSTRTIVGGVLPLGTFNAGLDMRTTQSVTLNAGSTVTTILGYAGQVARILVLGAGAVNLPAGQVHWSVGSPIWGAAYTLVNMWTHDGNTYWAATTPFAS